MIFSVRSFPSLGESDFSQIIQLIYCQQYCGFFYFGFSHCVLAELAFCGEVFDLTFVLQYFRFIPEIEEIKFFLQVCFCFHIRFNLQSSTKCLGHPPFFRLKTTILQPPPPPLQCCFLVDIVVCMCINIVLGRWGVENQRGNTTFYLLIRIDFEIASFMQVSQDVCRRL